MCELCHHRWSGSLDQAPDWLKDALAVDPAERQVWRSDDFLHVITSEGDERTVKPGDWIVMATNGYWVFTHQFHEAFFDETIGKPEPKPKPLPEQHDAGVTPSAHVREYDALSSSIAQTNGADDAQRLAEHDAGVTPSALYADPDNAAIEGAEGVELAETDDFAAQVDLFAER